MAVGLDVVSAGVGALGGVGDIFSAISRAKDLKLQGEIAEIAAGVEERLAIARSIDIRRIGAGEAARSLTGAKVTAGAQRAAYAAQGVDISSVSAQQTIAETELLGEIDAITLRNNARKMSEAEISRALSARFGGQAERSAYESAARQTLISGGISAARRIGGAGAYLYGRYGSELTKRPGSQTKPLGTTNTGGVKNLYARDHRKEKHPLRGA